MGLDRADGPPRLLRIVDGVGMGTTPIALERDARRSYEVRLVQDRAERVVERLAPGEVVVTRDAADAP